MAWNINRVVLTGRLAGDVDSRAANGGEAIAKFGLAVGGKQNRDGSDNVSFFDIVAFGKTAENCARFLKKGAQVAIEGRLQQSRWQAQDGAKRSKVEIIADRVEFMGSASGNEKSVDGNTGAGEYSSTEDSEF